MKRRIIEIALFVLAGISLADLGTRIARPDPGPVYLANPSGRVRVFLKDTVMLTDLTGRTTVQLYAGRGVLYLAEPFDIDSGRIRATLYSWIWYEHIFNQDSCWLVIRDENLRICNNCVKIGRVMANSRLQKVWSPPGRYWHLVRLDVRIPVRSILAFADALSGPVLHPPWPAVFQTTLTPQGARMQPRRGIDPGPKFDLALTVVFFVIMLRLVYAYLKRFRMIHPKDGLKTALIIGLAFLAGILIRILM